MIDTERLRLIPHTPEQLLALIEQPERYEHLAGFPAAPGLRDFFMSDEVSPRFLAMLRTRERADPWQLGFAVVHAAQRTVIGSAGFKGAPDGDGAAEVAYGIVPLFEGQGYATEVTSALLRFAFARDDVRMVRAHTLPLANASTHVLAKCGFRFAGEVLDPDDGLVWRWERTADPVRERQGGIS